MKIDELFSAYKSFYGVLIGIIELVLMIGSLYKGEIGSYIFPPLGSSEIIGLILEMIFIFLVSLFILFLFIKFPYLKKRWVSALLLLISLVGLGVSNCFYFDLYSKFVKCVDQDGKKVCVSIGDKLTKNAEDAIEEAKKESSQINSPEDMLKKFGTDEESIKWTWTEESITQNRKCLIFGHFFTVLFIFLFLGILLINLKDTQENQKKNTQDDQQGKQNN